VGAEPAGVTDCLNFGSPESERVMGQFVAAVEGIAEACRAFAVPVVSGNVSFYNETSGTAVLPTPTIGMVGVVPEVRHAPRDGWREGEEVWLLGPVEGELGGSRFLQVALGLEAGPVPGVDYEAEARAAAAVRSLVRGGVVAAKDLSDGGLAVAAFEMSGGAVGCDLALPLPLDSSPAGALFGEWRGGFLLAAPGGEEAELRRTCRGLTLTPLGVAGGTRLRFSLGGEMLLEEPVAELQRLREASLQWLSGT
jgi:phosphoribosylformylglycinamidine synthase